MMADQERARPEPEMVQLAMPPRLLKRLRKEAERRDMTVAHLLHLIVAKRLKRPDLMINPVPFDPDAPPE
jgi:predicted RNase H-like nuclease